MKQQTKNYYDRYWTERGDSGNRFRYKIFLSWLEPHTNVLDVGCGDGYLANLMREQRACQVTCFDISQVALKKVAERGFETVQGSLDEPLPFPDKSFDYVVATEIIEHIAFSEEALKELARVARRAVLVSIPNSAAWKYRWQLLTGSFPKQWIIFPSEHLRFWSISDFKKTLQDLDLKLEEIKACSGRRYLRDWWPNLFAEQVCYRIQP